MTERSRLAELTADQLLARADECWRMAETASTAEVRDALRRLAVRFEEMAETKGGPMDNRIAGPRPRS